MGFLTPGKSTRKRTKEHKEHLLLVKRLKSRSSSPQGLDQTPKTPTPTSSILERFPVEIIHEIFIHAGINCLPFVSKSLHADLTPSKSLCVRMIRAHVHDLNLDVPEMSGEYKTRYALDRAVLEYKFVRGEYLQCVEFDTVLSLDTIMAERKNRLVLYYDKLNKRMLDTLKRAESSEDEINAELKRIKEERERLRLDEVELSDLALEQVQDYPQRFYELKEYDEKMLSLVEELHNRSMKFMDNGLILSSAIRAGCDTTTLERLLRCTETNEVTCTLPLIAAFERDDLKLVDWLLSRAENASELLNDDKLWIHLTKDADDEHFEFITERGGVASPEVMGFLSTLRD